MADGLGDPLDHLTEQAKLVRPEESLSTPPQHGQCQAAALPGHGGRQHGPRFATIVVGVEHQLAWATLLRQP